MSNQSILTQTDSYKLCHWQMYPPKTTGVYSYLEARKGATYPKTVFFGLQGILKELAGRVVSQDGIDQMRELTKAHLGDETLFNEGGWKHILEKHNGHLPLLIKAVDEGSLVDVDNVLMTISNTDEAVPWLTNYVESILLHVWYPCTVATLSYYVKQDIKASLERTADSLASLPFMLHDFGYRGVTSNQSSSIGGAAHLINFMGTDTVPALSFLHDNYKADYSEIGFSVPATEHSVMTSEGPEGEEEVVHRLLDKYRSGILSLVGDSYDIYNFVDHIIRNAKGKILSRRINKAGLSKVVIRPDSNTHIHPEPGDQVVWIIQKLADIFGSHKNGKGFQVLNPAVGVLWGDGIGPDGIRSILHKVEKAGFSTECLVFGMGGGLLQKVNRDTQRFAFKCSHQIRDGKEVMVKKNPLDATKKSKYGMMVLQKHPNGLGYDTYYGLDREGYQEYSDLLRPCFYNGRIVSDFRLDEIRYRLENE